MFIKACILLSVICVVVSLPGGGYGPPKYDKGPIPYSFSYGVNDDYRGTNFGQNEKSDGKEVHGSYTVQLPDGRKQTVNYKADWVNGFVADVSYYGEAKYPSKSGVPFIVKPEPYHPEPAYKPAY